MPYITPHSSRSLDLQVAAAAQQTRREYARQCSEVELKINQAYEEQRREFFGQHGLLPGEAASGQTMDAMSRLFTLGDRPLRGKG